MLPIVGRDDVTASVLDLVASGRSGVLLSGEAGIGKTRLATAVVDALARGGRSTLTVAALGIDEVPLGGLARALPEGVAYGGLSPIVSLKDHLGAGGMPAAVLVDDADRLDPQTVGALVDVARSGVAWLVATIRTGATIPAPIERCLTDGSIERVECPPLDLPATVALVEHLAGAPVNAASAADIHRLTGGNPLWIRELVAAATETGTLRRSELGTTLVDVPASSPRLVDLLEARVARLHPSEREALHRIAVVGDASIDELASVVADDVLESLERRGLLRSATAGGELRFEVAHPLHAEVIRSTESAVRVRRVRTEHAGMLRRRGGSTGRDLLRLATWSLEGIGDATTDELTQAARDAAGAGDVDLAQRLAAAAFRANPSVATAELLAARQLAAGDFEAMKDHFPAWSQLVVTDAERANLEEILTQAWFWRGYDEAMIDRLVQGFDGWTDAAALGQVQAAAGALLVSSGRIADAVRLAESIGELPPGPAAVLAAMTLGHGWRAQGRPASAERSVATALEFYRSISVDAYLLSSVAMAGLHVQTLADAGRFVELDDIVADRESAWRDMGDTSNLALANLARAYSWLLRGDHERAVGLAVEAQAGFERNRHPGMRRWALTLQALAFAEPGRLADATRVLAVLDAERDHPAQIFAASLTRARAWVEHHRGQGHRAVELLLAGADAAEDRGNVAGVLECAHDLARQGAPADAVAVVDRLDLAALEGPLHAARVAHVRALFDGDTASLAACMDRFDALDAPHLAAEAAAAAARVAPTTAAARSWLGEASRRRSAAPGAAPSLARRFDEAGLTPREREVALLAAEGRSSREIADRLGNSHRTIDAHLGRIYAKLGIDGRLDLLEAAGDRAKITAWDSHTQDAPSTT